MAETSLELLQAMVERVLTGQRRMETKLDRIVDDLADLKLRTTNTEEALAGGIMDEREELVTKYDGIACVPPARRKAVVRCPSPSRQGPRRHGRRDAPGMHSFGGRSGRAPRDSRAGSAGLLCLHHRGRRCPRA